MMIFAVIVGVILWITAITALTIKAMFASDEQGPLIACIWGGAAIVLFAGPMAIAFSLDMSDPRLCARGHQEYRTTRGAALVGKMVVPTQSTSKVWVCEVWETP